jgi:type IV secretion system protein VirD4
MATKFNFLSASGKGKGLNIFKSSAYKEHEQTPLAREFWSIRWAIIIWLIGALMFACAFPVEQIWRYGWSPATRHWIMLYLQGVFTSGGLTVLAEIPAWVARSVMRPDIQCITPLLPIIGYYFLSDATMTDEFNPHSKDKFDEKSSNKATEADIKKMGLLDGFMMVLGYFKKKPLMLPECLSTLCVAPPGTGKTQGVVLPTIFDCPGSSMIINDPKPELKQKSSAYRATIGPVFILNWAGQDEPEKGIYYPSWNPLSPGHVPFNPEERDLYVDSIANTLIPDRSSSSADPHWTITGRAALTGFIQYIISKVERAKADDYFYARISNGTFNAEDAAVLGDYYLSMSSDPNAYAAYALLKRGELNAMNYVHVGTWDKIPDSWHGKEASLSMILDWLNASQIAIAEEIEERRRQGDQMVMMADPTKDMFMQAVDEARRYSYSHRAITELTQLASTPDKERGSIMSTALSGLNIFRNAAVRNRTSHSDFHFSDLRGMVDPRDGKIKPITVYLSINMVDAQALNPITAIFIELMSNFLLANAPGNIHQGHELGPYPVLFVMDEMPKMQKLRAIIEGPDLGRGQKISYLIIGQDLHQIQEKYGQDAAATIMSTTAAKIVLRQNDPDSAKRFSEMMGYKMKKKMVKGPDGKEKEETSEELLYSTMDVMKLPDEKQLVIYQGWYHRPIEADKQYAYKDSRLLGYMKMGECSPLPEFLVLSHHRALGYTGTPRIYDPMTKVIKDLA